jgi:acid phosphatase type 7
MHPASAITAMLAALSFGCSQARAETPLGILIAAGDIAKCSSQYDEKVADLITDLVKDADHKKIPVHVLALGDLAYDKGTAENFANCFDPSWGRLLKLQLKNSDVKRLMLPVPGNHEYVYGGASGYYGYFAKVGNPFVFQQQPDQKKQKANNKGYFALKFPDPQTGPWQLIGLNSELKKVAMDAQLTWLETQLKAGDATFDSPKPACVLAFWHKPVFSSGEHGHGDCEEGEACGLRDAPLCRPDEDAQFCERMRTMKPAYEVLYAQGASVVLAGHDHHFEQFKRLDANAKPDPQRGVRSFIVGTGGAPLYQDERTFRWGKDLADVYSHSSHGVLRIGLFADRYQWRFVPIDSNPAISLAVDGKMVDSDTCVQRP